ncbi:hypothetical protein EDB92DRAFT_1492430 [Lactarius akahatsu]|uniref:DUF6534 domain-containing protein n=1 Tax=Lactarius akahatsu TaxID=416441 RepID=A0AAD4Q4U0_9AGAM|nr:hypothetical protein EDB92DRAFT_1492430 [Lactarius akahatsu]
MSGHAIADIRNTYGCSFIGLIIGVMLFGITALQTWIYYWRYGNRDPKALKLFIAIIFLLDALHTSLCIYSIYWYLVLNFGNVEILGHNVWSMKVQINVNGLVDYMVQLYYARRVHIVGGSIIIPIIIVIFGTTTFALGFLFTTRATALRSHHISLIPVTCIGMGSSVVADILIAGSMCWFLYHKRTGFAKTDSMILTLMTYSIQSGLLTSVLACAMLISFSMAPSAKYSDIFFWPMSKVYANSLLAMLNSRDYVRERSSAADNAFGLSSIRVEQRSEGDKSRRPAVSVTVHRSATTDFPQGKRDHDVESSTIENRKLVWSLHFSVATTALTFILSFEGGEYSL